MERTLQSGQGRRSWRDRCAPVCLAVLSRFAGLATQTFVSVRSGPAGRTAAPSEAAASIGPPLSTARNADVRNPVARMTDFAFVVDMEVARTLDLFPPLELLQIAETVN